MRWILIGGAVVVAWDAIEAAVALAFRLTPEADVWWVGVAIETAIWAVAAYLAAAEARSVRAGTLTGGGVALINVVVGGAVMWIIWPDPFTGAPPELIAFTALIVVALGALTGTVAGVVARWMGKRRTAA